MNLVLGGQNPLENAAMFDLLFDKKPTYEELPNGTLNLAYVFKPNQEPTMSKSHLMTPRGYTSNTISDYLLNTYQILNEIAFNSCLAFFGA